MIKDQIGKLFAQVYHRVKKLNNGFRKIPKWAKKWEMNFNPDPTKQVQEIFFSRKSHFPKYPE